MQADSSARRAWKDGGQKKIVLPVKDLSEMYELKMGAEAARLPASLPGRGSTRDTAWHRHSTWHRTWQVR
ncbi:MAG: peptidyl-tRNA hydrolase [Euryarchaeota archaeon]|nr:peptidyl-tRNA hydrolase [Euryarchaeota archaeon]